jgi:predicted enzyme related to lactoylglutathione lyase
MSFKNAVSWFEIPSTDIARAQKFYETIFGTSLTPLDLPNIKMRMFPLEDPMSGVGGAIVNSAGFHKPSATDGPLIYLNGNPDVQIILDKVEAAGGKITVPKTQISPEYGYMAVFIDTEGNRIALHSVPQNN